MGFLYTRNSIEPSNMERFRQRTLKIIQESSLRITCSLIEEFAGLLAHADAEEKCQCFLMEHPIFLDPLAC